MRWEAHKNYIDIQYILEGEEMIGWKPENQLELLEGYSEEKDIAFYSNSGYWTPVYLQKDYFVILFPEDTHKPCCSAGKVANAKKIVFKVRWV